MNVNISPRRMLTKRKILSQGLVREKKNVLILEHNFLSKWHVYRR